MPNSFFEKLKKGMGIEAPPEEVTEEEKRILRKPKRIEAKKRVIEPKVEEPEIKEEKIEVSREEVPEKEEKKEEVEIKKEKWFEPEGELAIDVYQTETDLVIQSAIAGVKPEFLDISMERDVITIKGTREKPFEEEVDYFTQECYWGSFSREVILPVEVDPDKAEATMKEGILTIRIPKILREAVGEVRKRLKGEVSGEPRDFLAIHRKKECPQCGAKIKRIELNKKGTYFCPSCQK